jgi:hypothetical protein
VSVDGVVSEKRIVKHVTTSSWLNVKKNYILLKLS